MNKSHQVLTTLVVALFSGSVLSQGMSLRLSPDLGTQSIRTSPAIESADYIVALVNSEPITYRDIHLQTIRAEQRLSSQGMSLNSRNDLFAEVLEKNINDRILVQLAQDAGIKVDEATLEDAIQSIAAQNGLSIPQLMQRIKADGLSTDKFKNDLRDEILVGRVKEREFEARVRVSDADIREYIQQQAASSNSSQEDINIAQILIPIPDTASESDILQIKREAGDIHRRLLKGEDFSKIALEINKSAQPMGLKNAARYPDLFVKAVEGLSPGRISGVVQSGAGFHILKLIERKSAGLPPVTVDQTHARHILLKISPQMSESAAKDRLQDIRARILDKSASFEEMARQFSQDGSAPEGGDLSWASPGQFVPEFESAMNQLPIDAISEPVVSRYGVHLIQVLERKSYTMSDAEQREMVRSIIKERKIQEQYPQWLREIRASAFVEYRAAPAN